MKGQNHSSHVYAERIHQSIDYISEHLSEEISLERLSVVACFSPFHFHRIFSAFTGETPRDYIERLRLERAANLLCVTRSKTVSDMAYDCGFTAISSFSRAFKKHYGVSPSGFLQKHKDDFHSLNVPKNKRMPQKSAAELSSVQIKKLPAFHVAYIQTLEGYATGIPKAWNKLLPQMQLHNLLQTDSTLLGIPYDNPGVTPREKCRYRACITVPDKVIFTRGELKTFDLEEALYALYHFKGTREEISDAYAFFYGQWLIQSGYLPDEKPLLEFYPVTLMSDCSQNQLEYDIALPITPL
jgi:AraC family transcriptional regulator